MFFFIQNPWVLLGLAGTAVPILLHLQKRRSAKTVRFPSLQLLSSIHRTKRVSLRVRELLLLLIRTALILFLILGLSGIELERRGVVTPQSLSRQTVPDQVILIDTSYSMAYLESGIPRLQHAIDAAAEILQRRRAGQRFLVLPFSEGVDARDLENAQWTSDVERCLDRMREWQPCGQGTDVTKTLRQVSELIVDRARSRIWFFSDLQRTGWLEALGTLRQESAFRERLPETLVFPVGEMDTRNLWLEFPPKGVPRFLARAEGFPLPLVARSEGYGHSQTIAGTLQLHGQLNLTGSEPVACSVYDRRLQTQGDEQRRVEVPLVPLGSLAISPEPSTVGRPIFCFWKGEAVFDVDSGSEELDRLAFDNSIRWSVPVLWSLPVVLIRSDAPTVASRVLEACLSPMSDENSFFVKMTSMPVSSVSLEKLESFSVAVLQEGVWASMAPAAQDSLLRYVREGGKLIAFTPEQESFGLIASVSATAELVDTVSGTLALCDVNWSHPALMPLEGFGAESLMGVTVYRAAQLGGLDQNWLKIRHVSTPASQEQRAIGDPMPVLGEIQYGKGNLVFSGIGLEGARSDLASSVVFLPLIHQALKFLVSDQAPDAAEDSHLSGERAESRLESLSREERQQAAQDTGLLIVEEGIPLVGRRRRDLTVPLLMLVLGLALAELWIGNRQL